MCATFSLSARLLMGSQSDCVSWLLWLKQPSVGCWSTSVTCWLRVVCVGVCREEHSRVVCSLVFWKPFLLTCWVLQKVLRAPSPHPHWHLFSWCWTLTPAKKWGGSQCSLPLRFPTPACYNNTFFKEENSFSHTFLGNYLPSFLFYECFFRQPSRVS